MSESIDLFDRLLEIDAKLHAGGYPALSMWWRDTLRTFLRGGKRWLIGRVGRRGGKGLTSCKVAVVFAMHVPLSSLPPGERAYVQFLSVDRDEAGNRLRMIEAMLTVLGVQYKRTGDEIDLEDPDRPITFRVTTASIRGVVGRTTILVIADEGARWRDSETGQNPAREILASIGPSMSTQPSARGLFMSSPFSENDEHARRFDMGTTDTQMVAHAESWRANPTLTEKQTRLDEPDPRTWSREYAAVPIASVTSICGKEELAAVITPKVERRPRVDGGRHAMTMDAGFKHDRFVASVWHRELRKGPDGQIVDTIVEDSILHLIPKFLRPIVLDDAIRQVVEMARAYGITSVDSDGHYSEAISPKLSEHGIRLNVRSMSSAEITKRVENLQARIHANSIDLLDHEQQTKELLAAQLVAHSGGRLTLKAPERRGSHDDLVSCVLLACDNESVAKLPACGGQIEIEYAALHFDPLHGLIGGQPKFFERRGKGRVQVEPQFGSKHFIRWAQTQIVRGEWSESVCRWVRELGLDPNDQGLSPALLDPNATDARAAYVASREISKSKKEKEEK